MRQTRIDFSVDGQPVDGVVCGPATIRPPIPGVVVCHPHPLFGGNMDSPAVFAICRELAAQGIASIRFDFRWRAGETAGMAESASDDVAGAFEIIRQWDPVNPHRCALAGYSFGAAAILRALPDLPAARAFVFVAPPLSSVRDSTLASDPRPSLFLIGDRDRLVDPDALRSALDGMSETARLEVVAGADHALAGHVDEVTRLTASFLADLLC